LFIGTRRVLRTRATIRVGSQSDDLAFVNVNVVPMDRERVLAGQTVWISGGRIKVMGWPDTVSWRRVPSADC